MSDQRTVCHQKGSSERQKKRCSKYIYTHTHTEIYPAMKQNEILPYAATWIDLESIVLSEISQIEKHIYYTPSLTCRT